MSYQLNLLPMKEEYLSPEMAIEMEADKEFHDLTRLSEIEIRYNPKVKPKDRPKVILPREAYNLMKPFFEDCLYHHEEAWIMLQNKALKVLGVAKVGEGGLDETVFDQRIILQYMLKSNAHSVMLFHNHPSQNLNFSQQDLQLTRNIIQACKILRLECLDHIIVGENGYKSYTEQGYF